MSSMSGPGVPSTSRARLSRAKRVPEEYQCQLAASPARGRGTGAHRAQLHPPQRADGGGYGVDVGAAAYATIEGNVFDFNRHAVASDGCAHSGYIARFNYVLQGGYMQGHGYYNQHFDVHGTGDTNGEGDSNGYGGPAGEYYEIAFNTIRGDRPTVRRLAKTAARVHAARQADDRAPTSTATSLVHDDLDAAVRA